MGKWILITVMWRTKWKQGTKYKQGDVNERFFTLKILKLIFGLWQILFRIVSTVILSPVSEIVAWIPLSVLVSKISKVDFQGNVFLIILKFPSSYHSNLYYLHTWCVFFTDCRQWLWRLNITLPINLTFYPNKLKLVNSISNLQAIMKF